VCSTCATQSGGGASSTEGQPRWPDEVLKPAGREIYNYNHPAGRGKIVDESAGRQAEGPCAVARSQLLVNRI